MAVLSHRRRVAGARSWVRAGAVLVALSMAGAALAASGAISVKSAAVGSSAKVAKSPASGATTSFSVAAMSASAGTSLTMTGEMQLNGGAQYAISPTITVDSTVVAAAEMKVGPPYRQVAVGANTTYAITDEGTLWSWGSGYEGRLGDGTLVDRQGASQVGTATTWASVYAANSHAAAITTTGTLYTWGSGVFGQLGNGSASNGIYAANPYRVGAYGEWKSVSLGSYHTLAIKKDGSLWGWGRGADGEMGENWRITRPSPWAISAGTTWTAASAGDYCSMGIRGGGVATNGTLWTWGKNEYGELGLGHTSLVYVPTQVGTDKTWVKCITRGQSTFALKSDGTLWAWGRNDVGQLGLGDTANRLVPTQVPGTTWADIQPTTGASSWGGTPDNRYFGAMALKTDGSLWAWGNSTNGSICLGSYTTTRTPTRIGTDTGWSGLSAYSYSGGGAFRNGVLYMWGAQSGGDALHYAYDVPEAVNATWTAFSSTTARTLSSVDGTHTVWMWYRDGSGGTLGLSDNIYLDLTGPNGTIRVNDGRSLTNTTTAYLESWVDSAVSMRINGGAWVPNVWAKCTTLTLSPVDGPQTVTAQFIDEPQYSRILSLTADVVLDTTPPTGTVTVNRGISPTRFRTVSVEPSVTGASYQRDVNAPTWVSVSAGSGNLAGVRSDGAIWATGLNTNGTVGDGTTADRTSFVTVNSTSAPLPWKQVSVGTDHMLAIAADNTLWAWGAGAVGQIGDGLWTRQTSPVKIGTFNDWKLVRAGNQSSYALRNDGSLYAWGLNDYGQLGRGNTSNANAPVRIGAASDYFKDVCPAAGGSHTLAIKSNGMLYAWGRNANYQVGDASITNRTAPVLIDSATTWKSIAAAGEFSGGIKGAGATGELYMWGWGWAGVMGDGTGNTRFTPGRTGTASNWATLTAGPGMFSGTVFATKTDGSLWSWGDGYYGQLGTPSVLRASTSIPEQMGTRKDWTNVTVGHEFVAACTGDGQIWAWGRDSGRFGAASTTAEARPWPSHSDWQPFTSSKTNVVLTGPTGTKSAGFVYRDLAGNESTIAASIYLDATTPTGTITAAGGAAYATSASFPVTNNVTWAPMMRNWTPVTSIAPAGHRTVLTFEDGTVLGSGSAYNNSYSMGANLVLTSPTGFTGLHNWRQVASGEEHTLLLAKDGTLWSVGQNFYGALGRGFTSTAEPTLTYTGTNSWQSVTAGGYSNAGVKTDGTLWTWGYICADGVTRYSPTQAGTGFLSASVGYNHGLAVKNDGSLWSWGDTGWGQLGRGATGGSSTIGRVGTENTWVRALAGNGFSLGLKADGTLWAWGSNGTGSLGIGSATSSFNTPQLVGSGFSSFAAGSGHVLAVKADGTLWTWGYNAFGQLGQGGTANVNAPVQIGTAKDWGSVYAGSVMSYALKTDGTMWTAGFNDTGQLGTGAGTADRTTFGTTVYPGWTAYAASSTYTHLDPNGATKIGVSFKDGAENIETLYDDILLDLAAPISSTSGIAAGWSTTVETCTITASDDLGVDTIWYAINGGAPSLYTTAFPVTAEGTTTIGYRAVDKAGQQEATKTVTARIDTVRPSTATTFTSAWVRPAQFALSPTDATSGVLRTHYKLGAGAVATYTAPFAVPEATSTVLYWSVDVAGNVEATKTIEIHVDGTAPTSSCSAIPSGWQSHDVTVALSALDTLSGVAGISYRIDGGEVRAYSDVLTIGDGPHTLEWWATDVAGNTEATHTTTIQVDTTQPVTTTSIDGRWHNAPATVSFARSDAWSGAAATYYTINGGSPLPYTAPFEVAEEGTTTVAYWSVDEVGNVEDARTAFVLLDYTEPVSAIHGVPAGTASESVVVSLTAEDGIGSGVESVLYRFNGGSERLYTLDQAGISITTEGDTIVEYWSVDEAGNSESPRQSATIKIDYAEALSATTRNPSCLGCHSAATGPRRVRLDFSVGKVDRTTACPKCHADSLTGTHPYHNPQADCGSFCHPGWGASMLTAVPSVSTTAGAFASAGSKDVGSNELHVIHSSARWPANVDASFSRCASCHAVAACEACHDNGDDPVASTHAVHSASGSANYAAATPAWTGVVGYGVTGGDQSQLTAVYAAKQCGTPKCHNTSGLKVTEPVLREDYTHSGYPASNTPANTVASTGTWSNVLAASYTMGRSSTAGAANATRGITFTGQKAALVSEVGPNRGKLDVLINGVTKATVDCYAATKKTQVVVWESETMAPGTYTLSVRVRGERNTKSTSNYIIVDQFKVWESIPGATAPYCTDCHPDRTADHGYGEADHVADVGASIEPRSGERCDACHSMDLMTEHERAGSSPKGRGCLTCHESPRKSFAAWNQSCQQGGCHTPGSVDAIHGEISAAHRPSEPLESSCLRNCHSMDLPAEHSRPSMNAPVGCLACHGSSQFDALRAAGWNGTCPACHAKQHTTPGETGNRICLDCHGVSDALMTDISGSAAYGNTGGDHETGYGDSAHATATVPAGNDGGIASGIQCEACHSKNQHAASGINDFRTNGGDPSADEQAGLCLNCHSATGAETRGTAPRTWNDRDIATEFARASHHPVTGATGVSGAGVVDRTVLVQSTDAEFNVDNMFQTQALDAAGASLQYGLHTETPSAKNLLFYAMMWTKTFAQLDTSINTWNAYGFDPVDLPTTTGFSGYTGVVVDNKLLFTSGQGSTTRYLYTPPQGSGDGAWTSMTNTPFSMNHGSEANLDLAHNKVYYFGGGNSTSGMSTWDLASSTWKNTGAAYDATGTAMVLAHGAASAYSPEADKLFVVRGATYFGAGDGYLYSLAAPSAAPANPVFTNTGIPVTAPGPLQTYSNWGRMERFTRNGHDYLLYIGFGLDGTYSFRVFGNLTSATPTVRDIGLFPWSPSGVYGHNLQWDGADRIYLSGNTTGTQLYYITPPADPMNDAWPAAWQATAALGGAQQSGQIAFLSATPKPYDITGYFSSGRISADVEAPAGSTTWGSLEWSGDAPALAGITLSVEGRNSDGVWVTPAAGLDTITSSPVDLTAISTGEYSALRLIARMSSVNLGTTPRLKSWTLTARVPADEGVASLTCSNCHNAHNVKSGTGAWDMSRASNPLNTKDLWSAQGDPSATAFCLSCHSTATVRAGISTTSVTPYDVSFGRAAAGEFFAGWDKDSGVTAFRDSGHATSSGTKALCENCHDPHGSDNRSLAAWTAPSGWVGDSLEPRDNSAAAAAEQNLCFQCHGNGLTGHTADGAPDIATPMSGTFRHDTAVTGAHTDTETAAANTNRHAECTDCHNPHAARSGDRVVGSDIAAPALLGATGLKPDWDASIWGGMTGYSVTTLQGRKGDTEAYVCFKCHTAASGRPAVASSSNGTTYTATDLAQEFNPANPSFHNVLGLKTGSRETFTITGTTFTWNLPADSSFLKPGWTRNSTVTCSDCHSGDSASAAKGPHGATVRYMLDSAYPVEWKSAMLDRDQASGVFGDAQIICVKCHNLQNSNNVHNFYGLGSDQPHGHTRSGSECRSCHVAIPHGWKRPRLLVQTSDPLPYNQTQFSGRWYAIIGIVKSSHGAQSWASSDCQAGCTSYLSHTSPKANMMP